MIVKSVNIPEAALQAALAAMGANPFSPQDLQKALEGEGVSNALSLEAAKRFLQRERKTGAVQFDPAQGVWMRTGPNAGAGRAMGGVGAQAKPAPNPTPPPTAPLAPANVNLAPPPLGVGGFAQALVASVHFGLANLACAAAVLALVVINASFAWEIGENPVFRFALVMGLMASDLMRPLIMARGFWELEHGRTARGVATVIAAALLAPASILSSTTVISAALHLGAEEIEQDQSQDEARIMLQREHQRLQSQAAQAWRAWRAECARGGCGPRAARIEAEARAAEAAAQKRLDEMLAFTEAGAETSTFLSRSVKAMRDLGLFGGGVNLAIPPLLALTLEIAALFGPAMILSRRRGVTP